jgi:hypothetical protein
MKSILELFAQGISINPNDLGVPQGSLGENNVSNALKLVFGVAGAVALLIVTIAGFKYVLSQGNPQETAKAKNTILYALIGLTICLTAFAIVSFIFTEGGL